MKKYLLDTNICIFYLKGKYSLIEKIKSAGKENCFISEITIAKMKFDAANSNNSKENFEKVKMFENEFNIIPIYSSLDIYAEEKARLRKEGKMVDDFDLLIGATSVTNDLVMVTNNTQHLGRIKNIRIEDWTKS